MKKICSEFYPENNLTYTQKGITWLLQAIKIQPLYTRYWIYLGNLTTILADQETDQIKKNNTIKQADDYFNTALHLAPKHQEILTGKAKLEIVAGDYKNAKDYAQKCIASNSDLGDCYWYLGLAEIYLKNNNEADKNIKIAENKGYDINSQLKLIELANAYGSFPDYQNLAPIFEKLIMINPNNIEYHSTLALIYTKLGEYNKAQQEELKVSQP